MRGVFRLSGRRRFWATALFSFVLALGFESATAAKPKIGLILDQAGKDDRSFNASAYSGIMRAKKDFEIQVKVVEATDDNAIESLLRTFARRKFDLVLGIGHVQAEPVKKVAKQFPNTQFAVVDGHVIAPNVRALLFEEHEGSYLVGAMAALRSDSGKIGFIGGMDIPMIRRFQLGYEAGAKAVRPKVKIYSNYIGVTSAAWNNPPKAKELALNQYSKGADVIFHAAGTSGLGLMDAAEEKGKLAIGVDSNQNWIKPGHVLTSMLKRVDTAVYDTVESVVKGRFKSGIARYGLKNDGVDFAMDKHNKTLVKPNHLNQVVALKKRIQEGKLVVPDYYKKK